MKLNDIAQKNRVTVEDLYSICKDLGIQYTDESTDVSDNDAFLVQKKIETIKKEKTKKAEEHKSGKGSSHKIRLKRKVVPNAAEHIKSEIEKHTTTESKSDAGARTGQTARTAARSGSSQSERSSTRQQSGGRGDDRAQSRTAGGNGRPARDGARPPRRQDQGTSRPQGQRPQGQRSDRPYGQRPQGQRSDRPYGQRPQTGNRPFAQQGQRPAFGAKPSVGGEEPPSFTDDKHVAGKSKRNKEKDKEKEIWKNKKAERIDKDGSVNRGQYNTRKKRQWQEQKPREAVTPDHIEITENISVGDLSKKLNVKANEVIVRLLKLGVMATINQVLDADTAEILCSEYGTSVKVVSLYDETVIKEENVDNESDRVIRPPIVTVMGHVDHGKTKLLDAIRQTNVADGEHGGITQHIGAYQVKVKDQLVTFLDTPGHAAFTTMRARGASVTDIVVLVVAANDGVMPQTIEAINHAKEAKVPIIVAINKIDLPEANPMKVKQELAGYDLVPEEWGGQTLYAEISAKNKVNIEGLLELILMQSEILELKANPKMKAVGTVLEAKLDPGRGVVATLLIQTGSLCVGDSFVVGIYSGRVRAMFNDSGNPVETATLAMPVEVLGIEGIPSAGDPFQQVDSDKYAKQISQKRQELRRIESAKKVKKVTLEDLNELIKVGAVQDVCIIIKADVDGSVQALKDALEKLSTSEVRVKVIHAAAGGINESDIMLASASNAIVIGYHVRPTPKISDLADQEKVSIKTYNIIFEVTQDIKAAMEGMLAPEVHEEVLGAAEVRQIFKISKIGTIAGCITVSGKILRSGKVRLLRDGIVIFDGALKSLKRFKDDANEVESGQECGIGIEGYNDIKESDMIECYRLVEVAKKLD